MKIRSIYKSDWLKAYTISTTYQSGYTTNDFNVWPSISFPLKSAYAYRTSHFDEIIDTNDILFETDNLEFSVKKFSEFNHDLTLSFQFPVTCPYPLQSLIEDKSKKARLFKRTPQVEYLIRKFVQTLSLNHRLLTEQLIEELFYQGMIDQLIPNTPDYKFSSWDSKKIEKVKEFLMNEYSENLSLKNIADVCSTSQYHFSRIFKKETGYSPYEYVTCIRMEKAKDLLISDCSVTDCAFKVGYNSIENFSFSFKKFIGQSPIEFKKSNISKL